MLEVLSIYIGAVRVRHHKLPRTCCEHSGDRVTRCC